MIWRIKLALAFVLAGSAAGAVSCEDIAYEGNSYSVCEVDAAKEDLRLFYKREDGVLLGQFYNIDRELGKDGKRLAFAMNAGMYHDDRRPVGHYLENGVEHQRVFPNAGPGNFGMLPNGVFCIRSGQALVIETKHYMKMSSECRDASQSGPMLVIDGKLHPRFLKDSTSRYVRNGVGSSEDGKRAVFAISKGRVTFHEFGSFMKDRLGLKQALYFDGNISRLYAPALGRADAGFALGPVVGVVEDAD